MLCLMERTIGKAHSEAWTLLLNAHCSTETSSWAQLEYWHCMMMRRKRGGCASNGSRRARRDITLTSSAIPEPHYTPTHQESGAVQALTQDDVHCVRADSARRLSLKRLLCNTLTSRMTSHVHIIIIIVVVVAQLQPLQHDDGEHHLDDGSAHGRIGGMQRAASGRDVAGRKGERGDSCWETRTVEM